MLKITFLDAKNCLIIKDRNSLDLIEGAILIENIELALKVKY